jgi:hypothetical protein
MSTLLVDKIGTSLQQDITVTGNDRIHIGAFIPYLYVYNSPAGTFTFELIKSSITIFSQTFTSADIKTSLSTTNNYIHTFYPIVPSVLVQMSEGNYTVKISSSGYSPTEASYLGWIRQHENIQNGIDYTPTNDRQNPLAIRIKLYKRE